MENIMNYGKAQGMLLVKKYLPHLNPFQSIDIIQTLDEWNQLKNKYGQSMIHRIDYPIGQSKTKQNAVEGTNGFAESVPELISAVHEQGDNGAVLLAQTTITSPPRYLYLGGFNILFRLGKEIIIELVGRAFDGHELTQGLACHERYHIAWDVAPFIMSRAGLVRHGMLEYFVAPNQYETQRSARINFLIKDCHYSPEAVEEYVPEMFIMLDETVIRAMFDDLVLQLRGQYSTLRADGLTTFAVQGNVIETNGGFLIQPWEIFRPERWS